MINDLSPNNLAYLNQRVAGGEFPNVGAALNAAVDAMRREEKRLPMVSDEHMDAVEEALAELEAGDEGEEWDVEEIKRHLEERHAQKNSRTGA